MESFDKEIEFALIKGIDPAEHISSLLIDRAITKRRTSSLQPEIFEDLDLNFLPQSTKDELFQQLLAAAYSTLLVSVRK